MRKSRREYVGKYKYRFHISMAITLENINDRHEESCIRMVEGVKKHLNEMYLCKIGGMKDAKDISFEIINNRDYDNEIPFRINCYITLYDTDELFRKMDKIKEFIEYIIDPDYERKYLNLLAGVWVKDILFIYEDGNSKNSDIYSFRRLLPSYDPIKISVYENISNPATDDKFIIRYSTEYCLSTHGYYPGYLETLNFGDNRNFFDYIKHGFIKPGSENRIKKELNYNFGGTNYGN